MPSLRLALKTPDSWSHRTRLFETNDLAQRTQFLGAPPAPLHLKAGHEAPPSRNCNRCQLYRCTVSRACGVPGAHVHWGQERKRRKAGGAVETSVEGSSGFLLRSGPPTSSSALSGSLLGWGLIKFHWICFLFNKIRRIHMHIEAALVLIISLVPHLGHLVNIQRPRPSPSMSLRLGVPY